MDVKFPRKLSKERGIPSVICWLYVESVRSLNLDAIPVGGCGTPRGLDAITTTRYAAAEITKNRHPRVQIRR